MYGDRSQMTIQRADSAGTVSVAGGWRYLPVAEFLYSKFYVYGAAGERFNARPQTTYSIASNSPAVLYNAMIGPIIPYAIKGAIWYQGESNTNEPRLYRDLLPLMIRNWREGWNEGEFPFYFVQIAPYNYGDSVQSQVLRESQLLTLSTPRTGMAVTLDIGEPENIHPADKQSVGERLARWALAKDYNKEVPYSGPLYKSMKITGDSVIVSFDHADHGLALKVVGADSGFLIAGGDRKFVKADVMVKGSKLILYSAIVKNPLAVRYAWSNTPSATLFERGGHSPLHRLELMIGTTRLQVPAQPDLAGEDASSIQRDHLMRTRTFIIDCMVAALWTASAQAEEGKDFSLQAGKTEIQFTSGGLLKNIRVETEAGWRKTAATGSVLSGRRRGEWYVR